MSSQAATIKDEAAFHTARRINRSLTASLEKRALLWMAERAPSWLTSDQLTLLGLTAQIAAGAGYALARTHRYALLFVIFDVEAVFIFPWAVKLDNGPGALGVFGLVEMTAFIVILTLGLVYAWRKGVLRWA